MRYALLLYQTPEDFAARTDPEKQAVFQASFVPYLKEIFASGIVVAGSGLEPPQTATTVTVGNGERLVQDGPYADTKEQLGGFFIIDVPDLDTALDWAARTPNGPAGNTTIVEIRPCMPPPVLS